MTVTNLTFLTMFFMRLAISLVTTAKFLKAAPISSGSSIRSMADSPSRCSAFEKSSSLATWSARKRRKMSQSMSPMPILSSSPSVSRFPYLPQEKVVKKQTKSPLPFLVLLRFWQGLWPGKKEGKALADDDGEQSGA